MKKTEFGKAFLLILHNPRESEKTLLNNVGNILSGFFPHNFIHTLET